MNQNEIDAYRKIVAPSTLKNRIVSEAEKERKKLRMNAGICYGVAALCAALVLVFTFYPTSKTVLHYNSSAIQGEAVAVSEMISNPYTRTTTNEVLIPFVLTTNTEAEVSVSEGIIIIGGKEMGQKAEIEEDTGFYWSVSLSDSVKEYSLKIDNKKEKSTYCIQKDEADGFLIKKVN